MMQAARLLSLALVGVFCVSSVEPLASEGSFNNLFWRCLPNDRDRPDRNRIFGQTIPTGMTLHSFIDTVDRLEKKYIKNDIQAHRSALAFLHWFSLPDFEHNRVSNRVEQSKFPGFRYAIIERLFRDQLQVIADLQLENMDVSSDLGVDEHDDLCFMMRALSHTYETVCPYVNGKNNNNNNFNGYGTNNYNSYGINRNSNGNNNRFPLGQSQNNFESEDDKDTNTAQQGRFPVNLNSQRQRGRPIGRPNTNTNFNINPQMPNQQAAVPNVRESQVHLLSHTRPRSQNCLLREDGVVSISGAPDDAISMAPVLLGIAASRMDRREVYPFSSLDKDFDERTARVPMHPLYMGTIGQEIGMAVYAKLSEQLATTRERTLHEFDVTGKWNQSGCLLAHYLDTKESVAFTRAQMAGAVDGAVLGSLLSRPDFQGLSLAEVLRLYYSTHNIRTESQVASVCNRGQSFDSLEKNAMLEQASLMATSLAIRDGRLSNFMNQIDSQVQQVLSTVNPNDWRLDVCPRTNLEQCSGQSDLFVVLDPSVSSSSLSTTRQANILGRIVNGMEFRERRNSVRVYSGFAGARLRPYPENGQTQKQTEFTGFTASGCPACLANFMQSTYENRFAGDRELFIAINGTLNQLKSNMRSRPLATAGRVVLYFRMSPESLQDAQSAAEALISLRITHPELKIIAIGDEVVLKQINDRSGGLQYFGDQLLINELENTNTIRETESLFAEIKRSICETAINLENVACPLLGQNFDAKNNNNNNNNNNRNRMNSNNREPIEFLSGVNPGRVQFVSYDSFYFAGSNDRFSVQFSAGTNGHVKVCELSSDYEYEVVGRATGNNNNNNPNNNNINNNSPNRYCLQTSQTAKWVAFNYTKRCYDGARSCSALRYAVVGIEPTFRASGRCRAPFCESQMSVTYSVRPEGMICASSSVIASLSLIVLSLIAVMRLT